MTKFNFNEIEKKCAEIFHSAAKAELERLQAEGPKYKVGDTYLLDLCGGALLTFKDKRSSFCRELKKFNKKKYGNAFFLEGYYIEYGSTGRQEYSVNRAAVQAVSDFINKEYGANSKVRSFLD